jgi:cellulose synthase/poly-beta-1,6-N-acetylglucosamine synthase-like glycosyltransferase
MQSIQEIARTLLAQDYHPDRNEELTLTQRACEKQVWSVTVGICATTENESCTQLVKQVLSINETGMDIVEVIIATPSISLAAELTGPDPRVIVIQEQKKEGKFAALNRIIERASGELLVLASADIEITNNTIPRLIRGLASTPERGAVDSRVQLVNGDKLLMDRVSNLLWDIHNATLDALDGSNRLAHVAGDLLAVRRNLVDALPEVINDDAYLALKVREKKFLIKRVPDALVWICGPRNVTDYVLQRSRVLSGHLELITLSGKLPTTFEFGFFRRPRRSFNILVINVNRQGPPGMPTLIVAALLELVSFGLAVFNRASRRHLIPWRTVHTTKRF